MRRAAKRDGNESQIVRAMRRGGILIQYLSGKGVPDLLGWVPNLQCFMLFEVKEDDEDLTPHQVKWHAEWSAAGTRIHIIRSIADAARVTQTPLPME